MLKQCIAKQRFMNEIINAFEDGANTNDVQTRMSMSQFIEAHSGRECRICVKKAGETVHLLVERLGVGGGGSDVGITGGLVGAGGLLQSLGSREVGVTGGGVGGSVAVHVGVDGGKSGKHC